MTLQLQCLLLYINDFEQREVQKETIESKAISDIHFEVFFVVGWLRSHYNRYCSFFENKSNHKKFSSD